VVVYQSWNFNLENFDPGGGITAIQEFCLGNTQLIALDRHCPFDLP